MTTPIRTTDMTSEWLVTQLLGDLGEDVTREGLRDTPRRVVRSLHELLHTSAAQEDRLYVTVAEQAEGLFQAKFTEPSDEIIVSKDIEFVSLCEHHMLPFIGHVHVGYLPQTETGPVLGLSKIARVVDFFSRKLQVQERLTQEIANAFVTHLQPRGVGVVIEAAHFCQKIRGVKKQDAVMVTSALRGCFKTGLARHEFLSLVRNGK
jgi:GTP cyclohydrolase IA